MFAHSFSHYSLTVNVTLTLNRQKTVCLSVNQCSFCVTSVAKIRRVVIVFVHMVVILNLQVTFSAGSVWLICRM